MRMRLYFRSFIFTLLVLSLTIVVEGYEDLNQTYGKFSTSFETPHIPWAKPHYKGPVKVLSILPTFRQRESVELWQRLDCEIIPIMTNSMSKFAEPARRDHYSSTVAEDVVIETAKEALAKEWEVALVGKCRWKALPLFLRAGLLRRVHDEGAGLVIVLYTENEVIKYPQEIQELLQLERTPDGTQIANSLPWEDLRVLSECKPEEAVKTFAFGEGRIVALSYNQVDFRGEKSDRFAAIRPVLVPHERHIWSSVKEPPVYQLESPLYDYYMGLVAKAVLWAAGRQGDVRIQEIVTPQSPVPRGALPATKAKVILSSTRKQPARLRLTWTIRDELNTEESKGANEEVIKPGAGSALIGLPPLKHGKHFLDVWVREGEKVIDWASRSFTVASPCRVKEVKLDSFGVERGEPVKGTVIIEGQLPEGTKVYLEVWDAFDGLMARIPLKSEGGEFPFRFSVPDPRSILHTIVAKLEDKQGIIAEGRADFALPDRSFDELTFALWGGISLEPTFRYHYQQLRRLGVDTALGGFRKPSDAHIAAQLGLKVLPYTFTPISWYPLVEGKHIRKHCLVSDEKGYWRSGAIEQNRKLAVTMDPYSPIGFWLCEEGNLGPPGSNLCYCDKCVAAFREYLKKTYGTIEALNDSWGSHLNDFSEATPVTLEEALEMKQLPRWADFRRCMELRFTKITTDIVHAMLEANPRSIPGGMSTCGWHSDLGYDFWLFMKDLREFGPQPFGYEGIEARFADSFVKHPRRFDICYGLSSDEVKQRLIPWFALALGGNGLFYYHIGNLEGQGGFATMTPTLDEPVYTFGVTLAQVREIRTGIDKLLFTSKKADDGVRVLYSQMSLHASTPENPQGNWPGLWTMADYYLALEDAGIHHGTISYEELVEGKLKYPEIKALLLADAKALSEQEARAIREFCKAGGLVVTTSMPGVMNEHLKRLPRSPLADMFPKTDELTFTQVGKGKAVYIGDMVRGYGRMHGSGKGLDRVLGLARVLERGAGIRPSIRVLTAEGLAQLEVRPVLFQAGANNYVVLVRERRNVPPVTVSVSFPRRGYIYDVRRGKFLAKGDSVNIMMGKARVDILAQLPYRLEGVKLSAKCSSGRQFAISAAVRTNGVSPGHHIFYIVLKDEKGRLLPWYARRVLAPQGHYEGTFTIALNEPSGKYTIEARDVASGTTQRVSIRLK